MVKAKNRDLPKKETGRHGKKPFRIQQIVSLNKQKEWQKINGMDLPIHVKMER